MCSGMCWGSRSGDVVLYTMGNSRWLAAGDQETPIILRNLLLVESNRAIW